MGKGAGCAVTTPPPQSGRRAAQSPQAGCCASLTLLPSSRTRAGDIRVHPAPGHAGDGLRRDWPVAPVERLGPAPASGSLRPRCPQAQRAAVPLPPVPSVTAVLGAGPRVLAFTGSRGQFSWHSRPLPAGSPHSPLSFSPFPDSCPVLTPTPGGLLASLVTKCAPVFTEESASGESDLRPKKILHPHVSQGALEAHRG